MANVFHYLLSATDLDKLGNLVQLPMATTVMLIIVIIFAIGFDFINGFHDTANSIATTVSTRVLTPTQAIFMAATLNFIGALVSGKVASTISKGLVNSNHLPQFVVLAALIGAIVWNLITWHYGIPSSSSHALIGGLLGAAIMYFILSNVGIGDKIIWSGFLNKVVIPLFASPIIGFVIAFALMKFLYFALQKLTQNTVNKWFSKLQILSAAFMAFEHGRNDAQKSMGIITLALLAATGTQSVGSLTPTGGGIPLWVMILCALAMGFGTATGGWKIIKTMGVSIIKLRPIQGFAAEMTAATVITVASNLGAPISTTHVITSAVLGVGSAKRTKAVRWGIAKNIVWTWVLTIPVTMMIGAISSLLLYFGLKIFNISVL